MRDYETGAYSQVFEEDLVQITSKLGALTNLTELRFRGHYLWLIPESFAPLPLKVCGCGCEGTVGGRGRRVDARAWGEGWVCER